MKDIRNFVLVLSKIFLETLTYTPLVEDFVDLPFNPNNFNIFKLLIIQGQGRIDYQFSYLWLDFGIILICAIIICIYIPILCIQILLLNIQVTKTAKYTTNVNQDSFTYVCHYYAYANHSEISQIIH